MTARCRPGAGRPEAGDATGRGGGPCQAGAPGAAPGRPRPSGRGARDAAGRVPPDPALVARLRQLGDAAGNDAVVRGLTGEAAAGGTAPRRDPPRACLLGGRPGGLNPTIAPA